MPEKTSHIEPSTVNVKHGHSRRTGRSPTYRSWAHMLSRCTCQTDKDYLCYGGRGITVCERWRTFDSFLSDMGEAPEGMTIERLDNSQGYFPDNCKWASRLEQGGNTRRCRIITIQGITGNISKLARHFGLKQATVSQRIQKGWPAERWFIPPTRQKR